MSSKRPKVPAAVLVRAKAASVEALPKKPEPVARVKKNATREKVIGALKKLHPMD